jgi:hypothetical protein
MSAPAREPAPARPPEALHRRLLGALPAGLALLAEGAWIAVVAALVQAAAGQPVTLGPLVLALAALAGRLAARDGMDRLGDRWPAVAVALVVGAGVIGWLSDAGPRAALAGGDLTAALARHPGGWAAGLAFLRGIAHARPDVKAERDIPSGSLLAIGVVVIVAAFLLGGALPDAGRAAFLEVAVTDTVLFAAAGLVARSLARIGAVGGGFDWRRNPAWIGLLVVLVGAVLLVAVPGAFAIGPAVVLIVAALPVPLLLLGLLSGLDRRALRFIVVFSAIAALVFLVIRFLGGSGGGPGEVGGVGIQPTTPEDQPWMTVAAWLTGAVAVVLAIALLAALWMQQARQRGDEDVAEERSIDHGDEPGGGARRRWFRRPSRAAQVTPVDAVGAYRAVLAELSRLTALRRQDGETPAEHAARVRSVHALAREAVPADGGFGAALEMLAADYELARFGARPLTAAEDRRGVARWRRIRAAVRGRRPRPAPGNREGPP